MNVFEATTKVSKIVEQKYGCSVNFYYADQRDIDSDDAELFETILRNPGAQFIIASGKILIPVFVEEDLFGSIVIKNGSQVDPLTFEDLHVFLDTTLKEFIIKKETLRRLKISESLDSKTSSLEGLAQSSDAKPFGETPSNIIPLFSKKLFYPKNSPQKKEFQSVLFLTGASPKQTLQSAQEVHHLLNRSSFVPYNALELNPSQLHAHLLSLGKITIFLPEILGLSEKETKALTLYFKSSHTEDRPLFIVSTQTPVEIIEQESLLPKDLVELLKEFHLEFNRPSNIKDFCNFLLSKETLPDHPIL